VILGPFGRLATDAEKKLVRDAVTHPSVQPEAVAVTVLDADRVEYAVDFVIEVPLGPDAELIRQEAESRVRKAAEVRMVIGGEIPTGYLAAAAYGDGIIKVRDVSPVAIEPNPYAVPVLTECNVAVEVRS
jgi:phage-related baseplate assembly protein